MDYNGQLHKMKVSQAEQVSYKLILGEDAIDMNALLGKAISLRWDGEIRCIKCDKKTKSSFNQGFCYNCFMTAPESADCILRPELCKAHLGEGRDVKWEEEHHNQPHVVYLAASDAVKVGVTRETQIPTRWIDQGAQAAIVVAEVPNRYLAGVLEVELKQHFTDKTNWQRMLKNEIDESIDLVDAKWSLEEILPADLLEYFSEDDTIIEFDYPVLEFPKTVKSFTFDKEAEIAGTLLGIKGQYLLFDGGRVINLRRHSGYIITLNT